MDDGSAPGGGASAPAAEARQRWRLTFCRDRSAPPLAQRDAIAAWEEGLSASGLPVLMGTGSNPRPRLAFAAALPVGIEAERELAELFLADRLPIHVVRERLAAHMPAGHRLLDLHDVWLGEPGLQAQVIAADYRVVLAPDGPGREEIEVAARTLLATSTLPRLREKGGGPVAYDLRPLLGGVEVIESGGSLALRIRTMFHVQRGAGRPEEVLAALGDVLGRPLEAVETVREQIVVAEPVKALPVPAASQRPKRRFDGPRGTRR